MLVVETIGRIRRAHLWSGKSIRQIARDLKISRNTVRRILRSGGDVVFLRARDSAAPQARSLEGRDRSDADEERGGVGARASDADPAVRGAARLATRAATTPCDATPGLGAANALARWRAPMCLCRLRRAKPTSSTGATRSW